MRETESKQNMLMKTPQGALSPRDTLIPTPDFTAARLANLRMHGLPGARNVKQEWKKKKKKKHSLKEYKSECFFFFFLDESALKSHRYFTDIEPFSEKQQRWLLMFLALN